MRAFLAWGIAALAIVAVTLTLISLLATDIWWIQLLDFPRFLSMIAIASIALGCIIFVRRGRGTLIAMLAGAIALQGWRIYPYFVFAPTEVTQQRAAANARSASCFTLLGLNVYQYNRDYAATLRLIEREKPDILLLMETDANWVTALAPILHTYPHRLLRPLDNTYGLVFASRLPVRWAGTKNITDQNTPTVYAQLATRDGQRFDYIGLHPRPPKPGQDTTLRDRKIARAARAVSDHGVPVLAMGDFNDVPWSRTTQTFKRTGGFRDPRVGRGSYPTFPAKFVALGWPLDQLFFTPQFTFQSLRVLDNVGSDHRPLVAALCLPSNEKGGS